MKLPSSLDRSLVTIGLVAPTVVALAIAVSAPSFAEVFHSGGAEVTPLGQFFVRFRFAFLLLPLAVAALWRWWPHAGSRGLAVAVVGVLSAAQLAGIYMWSMYLPIFKLGQSG